MSTREVHRNVEGRQVPVQQVVFSSTQVAGLVCTLVIGLAGYLGGLYAMWNHLDSKINAQTLQTQQSFAEVTSKLQGIQHAVGDGILPVARQEIKRLDETISKISSRISVLESRCGVDGTNSK